MIEPGKPAKLTDVELVAALEIAASRIQMSDSRDLRHVGDALAGLALEAGARITARGRDELRDRCSRLEDAAFHFQTCATCRREGEGACKSGRWFAAYLCGEHDEAGEPAAAATGQTLGKIRNVSISSDGTLTAFLEVKAGGRKLFEKILCDLNGVEQGIRTGGRS